jgi:hypothetical protein
MGFLDNVFKGSGKYPKSFVTSITQSAETLYTIVNESIQLAMSAPDLDTKKSRLDYAMKKLVELIKLANEYSFLDFKKISSIYESIREVRNEIRQMELEKKPLEDHVGDGTNEINTSGEAIVSKSARPEDSATCPYCSYQFPVMPQKKGSCPSCHKMIYVWYSTLQNMKKLVTEEEAMKIEREISEHIEKYELLNKQEMIEETEDEVKMLQEELMEKDPTFTLDDAYFYLLNNKIKKSRSNSEKAQLFYLKALLLDSSGKDFIEDLVEARRLELLHLKTHEFVKQVQIISNPDSCKVCKADADKILSIDDALKAMPLPHKSCTRPFHSEKGFCRCTYLIVNK